MEQALHAVIGSLEFILSAVGSYLGALRRAVMEPDFSFRKVGPAALGQTNEQGAIRVSQRAVILLLQWSRLGHLLGGGICQHTADENSCSHQRNSRRGRKTVASITSKHRG